MGHLIYKLINPGTSDFYKTLNGSDYTFDIGSQYSPKQFMTQLGKWIDESKTTTSSVCEYSFDHKHGHYRAVDWQQYLLYIVPTMVIPHLKHVEARNGLMALVNACSIALQKEITQNELTDMGK